MLIFQGEPVFEKTALAAFGADLAKTLNIEPGRFHQLAAQLDQAAKAAKQSAGEVTLFELTKMLDNLVIDAQTPAEVFFVGMCVGRKYGEAEQLMLISQLTAKSPLLALALSGLIPPKPVAPEPDNH